MLILYEMLYKQPVSFAMGKFGQRHKNMNLFDLPLD